MPRRPRRPVRRRGRLYGPLSPDERWFLEVGFSLDRDDELEQNLERARRLWRLHKKELLEWARRKGWAGWRPWAYYRFEHGVERPADEAGWLRERGLLEDWERVELENRRNLCADDD